MSFLYKTLIVSLIFGISFARCTTRTSRPEATGFSLGIGHVPTKYDKILMDIRAIEASIDGKVHQLPIMKSGIFDLIEMAGGMRAKLVETVYCGSLNKIRLVMGEQTSVVLEGREIFLQIPSIRQSGLEVDLEQDLKPGTLYNYELDFNIHEFSAGQENKGCSMLKPVVQVTRKKQDG